MKNFTDYRAIVEFLKTEQKNSLGDAIKKAKVPPHLEDQIKDYFNPKTVTIKDVSTISDNEPDVVLCEPDPEKEKYFRGFVDFIYNTRKWSKNIAKNLSHASNKLLKRLPDPQKNDRFQYKGLVVGHIQSGKTANMSALIARAADHGYRFFIVLSGRYKDLRLQTQNRMDQGITGKSESGLKCVEYENKIPQWIRMTIAEMDGDFKSGTVDLEFRLNTPKLAVIKKNTQVMEKLIQHLKSPTVELEKFPALIIDDECDDASIDIKYAEDDPEPSKTNAKIRELLKIFPKYTYVGFTATPYANVLIDADAPEDLYPKNFIAVLDEPKSYFGPRQLFGLGMTPSELSGDESNIPDLDVIRLISESDEQSISEPDHFSDEVPEVIEKAILTYVLSCCGRMARGQQDKHFSMLIHPSHRMNIHEQYKQWVEKHVDFLKTVVQHPAEAKECMKEAKKIWEEDFKKTSESTRSTEVFDFDYIWRFAREIVDSIEIKVLNSNFQDTLEYHKDKRRYIVVGGNKLSRGLTLEGLSVSLYLRPEPSGGHKYDTLLQMGRWFGYREGYHDLTRIFVNPKVADDFSDLARVELELRENLKQYSRSQDPCTPLEIKPFIRAHHTMSVTSDLKFGAGRQINISLQSGIMQTVDFPLNDIQALKKNQQIVKSWLKSLGEYSKDEIAKGGFTWKNIQPSQIINMIKAYTFGKQATRVNKSVLTNYIERQNKKNELTDWTVILPSGSGRGEPFPFISGVSTGKVIRRLNKRKAERGTAIKVLIDTNDRDSVYKNYKISPYPKHSTDPKKGALLIYVVDKKSGAGTDKALFPNSEGEDIIGLAFVFPHSKSHATVEYVTQERNL